MKHGIRKDRFPTDRSQDRDGKRSAARCEPRIFAAIAAAWAANWMVNAFCPPFGAVQADRLFGIGPIRNFEARGGPASPDLARGVLLICVTLATLLHPRALSAAAAITYVQGNYADPQTPQTKVTVPFTTAQTAGHLNVVVVGWFESTSTVSSVTDTSGNTYTLAVGPTDVSGYVYQSVYYAKNIAAAGAGANAVTITFSTAAPYPDIRILEYSGASTTNPVDVTAVGSGSNGTTSSSAAATTTNPTDLIFGANLVWSDTSGPGSGFTERLLTQPDTDIAEDKMVTATGSYSASAPLGSSGEWVMQMVAFRTPSAAQSAPAVTYVQGNDADPQSSDRTVTVPFTAAQTAGDLNVVVVGWFESASTVTSVTDKSGNTYTLGVGPTSISGYVYQSIYYAKNIAGAVAGANSVTVTFSTAAPYPDIRILEYSGANTTNPVDVTAVGSGSNGTTSSSAAATTTNAADLIFGANIVWTDTGGPGSGFTERLLTQPDTDIAEDEMVTATGSYSASAPLGSSGEWVMQMIAFRSNSTSVESATGPVLSASPSSLSFGDVTLGTTSTLPVVVTNTGSGALTISQTSVAGTGFSVSGPTLPVTLGAGGTTSFSVEFAPAAAASATGSLSIASNATGSSSVVSLSGTGVNQSVTLNWTASTSPDITGYDIFRATVSGGPYTQLNSAQVTGTSYTDITVEAGTTYYYVATAVNSQGVQSGDSNQATAVVPSP